MLITFFRAIILYTIVLIVMRLMGKREIGQLQPFELAISIMIADLASIPMTEIGIPISNRKSLTKRKIYDQRIRRKIKRKQCSKLRGCRICYFRNEWTSNGDSKARKKKYYSRGL